ncbi:hypothetical protein CHLRE_13g582290v5 [Chlamydomonas reinhardtii]|uniref:Uncharacterized protein n=1 Tax=Chlamydomonas reinhardtii TaxID=3055 RepID=A0A2K3D0G3_CHLRE|nr:uncharacterized protein CHLRE_13g582290v5 [Chlamydomonas reinhardtii]PNW74026.1 hypothetical protein CHLRE_13g582290v5 [Chlamydomonas reinhardtii]
MAVDPPADSNLPSGLSATPGAVGQNPPPAAVSAQPTTAGATTSQVPPAFPLAVHPPAPSSAAAAARPSFVDRLMAREAGWSPEFLQQYRQELTRLRAAIPPPPEASAGDGGNAGVVARDFGTPAWHWRGPEWLQRALFPGK